jgi:hypothetical protein
MSLTTLIVVNAVLDSAVAIGLGALLLRPFAREHREPKPKLSPAPRHVELPQAA